MPLHAMAKDAALLVSEIFEKGLEPPLWNSVRQSLFVGDLFFFMLALTIYQKFVSAPLKSRHPKGGVGGPDPGGGGLFNFNREPQGGSYLI